MRSRRIKIGFWSASTGSEVSADQSIQGAPFSTADEEYAERLRRLEGARWKRILNVQAPYRWNLRRLHLGRVLDVGCGIGRNLAHLDPGSVGVDHNAAAVAVARERGLTAYRVEEFLASQYARPYTFDSMLLAHVVEHMSASEARDVVSMYLDYIRPDGRIVFITPQEKGFASDPTHVRFVGFAELAELAASLGLRIIDRYSFPLPRWAGTIFTYNEFNVIARRR